MRSLLLFSCYLLSAFVASTFNKSYNIRGSKTVELHAMNLKHVGHTDSLMLISSPLFKMVASAAEKVLELREIDELKKCLLKKMHYVGNIDKFSVVDDDTLSEICGRTFEKIGMNKADEADPFSEWVALADVHLEDHSKSAQLTLKAVQKQFSEAVAESHNKSTDQEKRMTFLQFVMITIAIVVIFAMAIVGAFCIFFYLKRRPSSRSNDKKSSGNQEMNEDLDDIVVQKLDRLYHSLSKESLTSQKKRKASQKSITIEMCRKADLDAAEEKESMDRFIKHMREEFPEISEKTQREGVSKGDDDTKRKACKRESVPKEDDKKSELSSVATETVESTERGSRAPNTNTQTSEATTTSMETVPNDNTRTSPVTNSTTTFSDVKTLN